MNRLAPCDRVSSTSRIHRRVAYGVQHVVGHGVRIFLKSRIDCVIGAQYRLAAML
jgi:hypothetical protein